MDNGYIKYTTKQGDTFDMLAFKGYKDEFKSYLIIQANPQYADVLIFNAGVELRLPIIKREASTTLPPWKRG